MQPFEIRTSERPSGHATAVHVVQVRGEVDLLTAHTLRGALMTVLEEPADDDLDDEVDVDLSAVTFMDAAGVSTLVQATHRASELGRVLRIRRPSPAVRRVVHLCGLDGRLLVDHLD